MTVCSYSNLLDHLLIYQIAAWSGNKRGQDGDTMGQKTDAELAGWLSAIFGIPWGNEVSGATATVVCVQQWLQRSEKITMLSFSNTQWIYINTLSLVVVIPGYCDHFFFFSKSGFLSRDKGLDKHNFIPVTRFLTEDFTGAHVYDKSDDKASLWQQFGGVKWKIITLILLVSTVR